jgi:hypothetical protein
VFPCPRVTLVTEAALRSNVGSLVPARTGAWRGAHERPLIRVARRTRSAGGTRPTVTQDTAGAGRAVNIAPCALLLLPERHTLTLSTGEPRQILCEHIVNRARDLTLDLVAAAVREPQCEKGDAAAAVQMCLDDLADLLDPPWGDLRRTFRARPDAPGQV